MKVLRYGHFRVVPWRGGGSTTREIALGTVDEDWWRISIADVDQDGPFSAFPECDRITTTVSGSGLQLLVDAEVRELEPLVPLRFHGEQVVTAHLTNGPTRQLNVIYSRDRFDAAVNSCAIERLPPMADATARVCLALARLIIRSGSVAHHLKPLDAVEINSGDVTSFHGDGIVVVVDIYPAGPLACG